MHFINNLESPKFDFHDIALVPSVLSKIESRSEIKLPSLFPLIASYIFISINSKTRASLPVGSSLKQNWLAVTYILTIKLHRV